jgi:hypothetical protein
MPQTLPPQRGGRTLWTLGEGADGSSKNGNQKSHHKGLKSDPTVHSSPQSLSSPTAKIDTLKWRLHPLSAFLFNQRHCGAERRSSEAILGWRCCGRSGLLAASQLHERFDVDGKRQAGQHQGLRWLRRPWQARDIAS